jgi:hypothetical protein
VHGKSERIRIFEQSIRAKTLRARTDGLDPPSVRQPPDGIAA